MNHRIIATILLILSLLAITCGYLLSHPTLLWWCVNGQVVCIGQGVQYGVALPLYTATRLLPVLFCVLIFVRTEVFTAWWKIATPLSLILLTVIVFTPSIRENPLQFDRTHVAILCEGLLLVVSALVILWKYWLLRGLRAERSE